jgi:transposase
MGVYNVSEVDTITDGRDFYYGFRVIGVHGQPLISFSFETSKEAEAAHKAMLPIVATAKIIMPTALPQ